MTAAVKMTHITKEFAGVPALRDVTLTVEKGEVLALLGENGAGKSTLMKILSGAYEPTSGTIEVNGRVFSRLTPHESNRAGISIIYQELSVINELSIWENIFVGRLLTKTVCGVEILDLAAMRARTVELLQSIGLYLDPNTIVGNLSISTKQMVEILRAVAFDSRVIVMDEPSTSLSVEEVRELFRIVRHLKGEGRSLIFISHKLEELLDIADRVTVLKDGAVVGTRLISEVTVDSLVSMMVGRELQGDFHAGSPERLDSASELLSVRGLTRRDERVKDASFVLRQGEILGFSGLVGSGRTELMEAIFGAEPIKAGTIWVGGVPVRIKSPHAAIKSGLAMVTENRRESGIFHNFSIRRNISVAMEQKSSKFGGLLGLFHSRREQEISRRGQEALQIKCRDLNQRIIELSGGNQQKVLIARWQSTDAKIYIFDEPTKGIDVGTKSEIYRIMRDFADRGIGVIMVSSELPEILSVCDRVLVMAGGRIVDEFSAANASEESLVRAASR
ncbi:sugar ABC transporter ATP-binding protein [Acidipropionibacterium timonense]|uniref:sugar ABC transporter ATP-binding protein n=1 Tax=Acidipropionibacterium timonense TaxID=2161818 RepID=UPI0010305532|nr:ATP-binding cassette domain-containing protein [Acidipropionibacterium timonense]